MCQLEKRYLQELAKRSAEECENAKKRLESLEMEKKRGVL